MAFNEILQNPTFQLLLTLILDLVTYFLIVIRTRKASTVKEKNIIAEDLTSLINYHKSTAEKLKKVVDNSKSIVDDNLLSSLTVGTNYKLSLDGFVYDCEFIGNCGSGNMFYEFKLLQLEKNAIFTKAELKEVLVYARK